MNIVFVTRSDLFPPHHGAAVKIVRTAEALAALGAGVSLVSDDRDSYLRLAGAVWERVPYPPRLRAAEEWPPLPRLALLAERLLGRLGYPAEEHFLYRPLIDPAWWLRTAAVGRLERADVFQAEFPGYGLPALLAARLLGARAAIVQHNVEYDRLRQMAGLSRGAIARLRAVEIGLLRGVDEVVAVSPDARRLMTGDGLPAERCTVIPHGVELARFAAASGAGIRARYRVADGVPLLFFHGVLHYAPNAGAVRFIVAELLPRLLPLFPQLRVLIAGMSPPRYYDHPAVVFTGAVDDLEEHIAAADLCLCPIDSGGGTRMKLLEYFAAAKAVVSTRKGAEGLRSRHQREIWHAEGAEEFAAACTQLLRQPDQRRSLGQGAQRFAQRYDWRAIGQAYLDLYRGEGRGADWNQRLLRDLRVESAERPARAPMAAHLPRHRDPQPLTMLLLINRGCNLRCAFCDLADQPARMALGRVEPLFDQAVTIGTRLVVFTGGEPFLHPGLFQAVDLARQRGLGVNITTNGTLVQQRWEELIRSGVQSVSVSLDGGPATHDALRGRSGAYAQALAALERIAAQPDLGASVHFTVTRRNVGELEQVFDLSRQLGADFDFWPVNDAPELALRSPQDRARYLQAVQRIAERSPAVAARREYLEQGLRYHAGELERVRCLGLVEQYGVTWRGDLLPCCVWGEPELVVGNVFETPLDELWISDRVQELRQRIFQRGCGAGCYNHSLREFERATGEGFVVED